MMAYFLVLLCVPLSAALVFGGLAFSRMLVGLWVRGGRCSR